MTRYRDGQGQCLTCGGPCDARARRCRDCTENAERLVCPSCRRSTPREDMTLPSGRRTSYCPPCRREWHRNNKLVTKYGITAERYDDLLAQQGGGCAICGRDGKLVVDHDHATGAVRGLLCGLCNTGIGHLGDSPVRLRAAAAYILGSQA